MLARLPSWQDVAAEHHASGWLNAELFLSSLYVRSTSSSVDRNRLFIYFQPSIEAFFKKSINIRQRGLARPDFFLLGDGAIAPLESLAPIPWHVRVTSVPRITDALVC